MSRCFWRFVKYGHDAFGDARLSEPERARIGAIQCAIEIEEALAGHVLRGDGPQV